MRILIVEEDDLVGGVLGKIVCKILKNCQVKLVYSAEAAVDLIEQGEKFDLLMTDYRMSGKDGIWLSNWLRQKGIKIPIILMSGGLPVAPKEVKFLSKPFSFDDLQKALAESGF